MATRMPRLKSQFAMLIIKPEAVYFEGVVKDYLFDRSFDVRRRYEVFLPEEKLRQVYQNVTDSSWIGLDRYVSYMASVPTVTLFLVYEKCTHDAQAVLKSFIGDKNPTQAPADSLRGVLRGLMENKILSTMINGAVIKKENIVKYGSLLYVENGDFWLNAVHAPNNSHEAGGEALALFGKDIRDFLTQ